MTATPTKPIRILLQTTIAYDEDDWHVGRFSLLRDELAGMTDAGGTPLAEVTARNREPDANGIDPVLSTIDRSDYDQVWIIGVDAGGDTGISADECAALSKFRRNGGAIFSTRDHQDLGVSLCNLGGIGAAHYFHSAHPDPDPDRNRRDDPYTPTIDFPNYHSGSNGDVQHVRPVGPVHPDGRIMLTADGTLSGRARRLPFARNTGHIAVLARRGNETMVTLVAATGLPISQTTSLAGEPRDDVSFDGATPEAVRPGVVDQDLLVCFGAAVRLQQMAGALEKILEQSVQYALARVQFGRPIAKFQAVQHSLATLAGEVAAASAAASAPRAPARTRTCART